MTDLDRQSRLYAADRLLDTMDGTFRAQHIKQAYMDGYNAARKEILIGIDLAQEESKSITSITPITSTP
jgi:hypothetical protein